MPFRWPWSRREDAAPAPLPVATALTAPTPPTPPGRRARRTDWTNQATGMGIAGVDPALATFYLATQGITDEEAVDLHRTDPIAAKLINKPVDTAFEKGFEVEIAEDDTARDAKGNRSGTDERKANQLEKDVKARWKALGAFKAVRKAWKYSRREGGAAILLGCVDVGAAVGMSAPIAPEGMATLKYLRVLRARELWPATWYDDPSADKFDEPKTWRVSMLGKNSGLPGLPTLEVHESRLIIFEGEKVVDEHYRGQLHLGFGDSVILRFYRALRRYGSSMAGIEKLLARFGQPHMKMKDLAKLMGEDKAGDLNTLLDAYEYAASTFNVRVMDAEDDYETTAPTVTGLPDLINQVRGELQAAADMPLTILFGDVVGGLGDNSTGVKRDWLDTVAALRDEHAIPPLTRITELILRGIGSGKLPGEWEVKGCKLWHPTAKEQADVDKTEMEIDTGYLAASVVTSTQVMRRQEVARRFAIDLAALDDLEAAQAAMPDDVRNKQAPPDPNADPSSPPPGPAGGESVQQSVLNGAQITAMFDAIARVAAGELPREAAIEGFMIGLRISREAAVALLGPEDFEPTKPPPPVPFGGHPPGAPPIPPKVEPGAAPPDGKPKPGNENPPAKETP